MNLICDRLPESVEIDGEIYFLNTDFKVWMKIEQLLNKRTESALFKALCLCFKRLPPDALKALSAMTDFLMCGKKAKQGSKKTERLYDFDLDSGLILSSFLSAYNIDLRKTSMHWYVFVNLISSLPENTVFSKAVFFRGVDLSLIKNKEDKKYYKKMKSVYRLEEKIDDDMIADSLGGAFNDDR